MPREITLRQWAAQCLSLLAWGRDVLHRGWVASLDYLVKTYHTPFRTIDVTLIHTKTLEDIEQARRMALLRCIVLSFSIGAIIVFFIIFAFPQTGIKTRIGNGIAIAFCVATLGLSYSRYARFASYFLLWCGFFWVTGFSATDPSGLSIRSVLLMSGVSILILGAGLVLPPIARRITVIVMSALAWGAVWLMPIKEPSSAFIMEPRVWALVYLGLLYSFTAILSWLSVRTITRVLEAFAAAYAREYELERQKDEFLHIASHELRAPLVPLVLAGYILEQRLTNVIPEGHESWLYVEEIHQHVKRMDRMVDLLLDVTRIDNERFQLDAVTCDIALVIRDVAATQRFVSRRAITATGVDAPVLMEGDARRLWQVFSNLLGNAVKYTSDETPIEIILRFVAPADRSGEWVQVIVHDHGPGIPEADLPHVFDRYYRVADLSMRQVEGWGLGLFLCQTIVTAHGGTIDVASTLGEGTTFTVLLPRDGTEHGAAPHFP